MTEICNNTGKNIL